MSSSPLALRAEIAALLPRLRRFARSVTHHREDADDLVQIAGERALKHLDQWQDGTRLASWLFRIMKNAWIDEVRARGRRDEVLAPEEAGEHVGHSETGSRDIRLSIEKAMATLPDEQRMALVLGEHHGLSIAEIADAMEIPEATAKTRLFRAREKMRAALQGTNDEWREP